MPLTRRLILQKARHHPPTTNVASDSDGLKAPGFRNYFTPLPGYFSPFPHGTIHYRSHGVFRLTKWSWQIHTRFHESRTTREYHQKARTFRLRDSHPLRSCFPTDSTTHALDNFLTHHRKDQMTPTTPNMQRPISYHTHPV